jgi:hypothetical protein
MDAYDGAGGANNQPFLLTYFIFFTEIGTLLITKHRYKVISGQQPGQH